MKTIFKCIKPFFYVLIIQLTVSLFFVLAEDFYFKVAHNSNEKNNFFNFILKLIYNNSSNISMIVSLLSTIIGIFILLKIYRNEVKISLKISKELKNIKNIILMIALGLGLQFVSTTLFSILALLLPEATKDYRDILSNSVLGITQLSVFYIVLLGPFYEELIFRGIILERTKTVLSFKSANVLQAILFSIYHFSLAQIILNLGTGIFLGLIYRRYKTIFAPLIIHAVSNLSGIIIYILISSAK